jgi:hypothetical protein
VINPAIISALAALGGSSVGPLAPILSNYVAQRSLTQRDLLNRQIDQRETLYSDFIKEAARLHANSMTKNLKTLDELVSLHAMVSRIRLVSSEPVLLAAEAFVRRIVRQYGEPNLSVEELRAAVLSANGNHSTFSASRVEKRYRIFFAGTHGREMPVNESRLRNQDRECIRRLSPAWNGPETTEYEARLTIHF